MEAIEMPIVHKEPIHYTRDKGVVPISQKCVLTLEEAAQYSNIGMLLILLSSQLKTIPVTGSMDHTARRIIFKLFHMKIPESKQMCIQNIVIGTL